MSDAPKMPHLWLASDEGDGVTVYWRSIERSTKYIRADIAERWQEALKELANKDAWGPRCHEMCDIAQEALGDE